MSKQRPDIDEEMARWIARQHIFFVGTAPLSAEGHVNVSPKGGDSLRVLGPTQLAYQDLTGSSAETVAHLRENGRIVIMFCAFEGSPKIVRLHGVGSVLTESHPDYASLAALFPVNPGMRAIIRIQVRRVSDSCGYSVPRYAFEGPRDALDCWAAKKGAQGLQEYRATKNRRSIDGLPAFDAP